MKKGPQRSHILSGSVTSRNLLLFNKSLLFKFFLVSMQHSFLEGVGQDPSSSGGGLWSTIRQERLKDISMASSKPVTQRKIPVSDLLLGREILLSLA